MRHALSLAAHGPVTGPHARVGCVLLDDAGATVAEGWHRGAGTPHAEVDALAKLPGGDARGLTAVVTLEPCNHWGRTGPCSEALIEAGINRVVFSVEDPGAHSGGGKERLRDAGVPVEEGVLVDEVSEWMRRWLTAVQLGRPFVTVKWASSLDGRAAAADGTSQWITGAAARQHVHEQRAEHDAILVGTGTVLSDDPSLTARGDGGELLASQPVPVVVGERSLPATSRILKHPREAIVTGTRDLDAVLADLYAREIRTVFVEGGPTVASEFIRRGLADDILVYLAPTLIGGPGLALGDLGVDTIDGQHRLTVTHVTPLGDDLAILARTRSGSSS
ncbi:bifunctional diaminohydroxyphosphoribosylaminopyrimidine deaminase/5-amino-6-(5-phosphoribosylamino)uracil reductase RibD [Frondihabitans sp. VKM Ac-2883]|uniref:bifunctional diaminohydroxyphosphoribosylaminopyrimidine deaminase/5-amino-6-(5-phosphoribosylamino)uracil reductase RibD n=1 Tax=Frondihabitans sp. VKM Ac-2883 TaxID=2783823 RepID=UPI00188C4682|nr:bifunctional diaminohydroxyphosphoribosylaminopyrimidine deaminase/5-amino-6-(5-phosphoribosylamino)uracil reductase RibD [Frondihabitans sp. VKM Ac-2883]MBF4575939.1 bifunctional diaminohydroxyphosphoribosylaminopyrimidine deaminase/5-amino-6-(5-phosphoribosylamino)uracil reductase RibD [Frondihabitans sp. VKM Ac-2883]